jgi:parvulin-like peptidyl-prolyl isomerase
VPPVLHYFNYTYHRPIVSNNKKVQTMLTLASIIVLFCQAFHYGLANAVAEDLDDAAKIAELRAAIPFYVRPVEVFGYELYPVTLVFSLVVGRIVIRKLFHAAQTKTSNATASHILLKDSSEEGRKKLQEIKKEIQGDPINFARAASKHSACPSGKSKFGSLGRQSRDKWFHRLIELCLIQHRK